MLGEPYITRQHHQQLYDGHLPVHSQLQVSLGLKRDLSKEPHWVTYLLDKPVEIASEQRYEVNVKHYCFDPSLAPEGTFGARLPCSPPLIQYWQRLYGRASLRYRAAAGVRTSCIDWLESVYPGLKQDILILRCRHPAQLRALYRQLAESGRCLLTQTPMFMMLAGMRETRAESAWFLHGRTMG